MKKKQITIQLSENLIKKMNNIKETIGSSRNFIIERAISDWLDSNLELIEKKTIQNRKG